METIKNYLEAMFANLPNTDSVRKAKYELLQMMEDKYSELIGEGASENEAVGTVISEFGNLDDLAEELGLQDEIKASYDTLAENPRKMISFDQAKEFIAARTQKAFFIALGVLLCILSVCGPILAEFAGVNEMFGVIPMFLCIAIAVGLFIYGGAADKKYKFVKQELCQIDMMTADYIKEEDEKYEKVHLYRLIIGVVLCVICWLPSAVLDEVSSLAKLSDLGGFFLFVVVGIGVFMIVYTNIIKSAYEELLKVNDINTVSGTYGRKDSEIEYNNENVKILMEIYWPVVTCIYLIWSFITFDWWISWIVWPIASIIAAIIKIVFRKK